MLTRGANECASHSRTLNGISNYCCLEATPDFQCVFFTSKEKFPRCRYFEQSVLPLDPALEAVYYQERDEARELTKAEIQAIRDSLHAASRLPRRRTGRSTVLSVGLRRPASAND